MHEDITARARRRTAAFVATVAAALLLVALVVAGLTVAARHHRSRSSPPQAVPAVSGPPTAGAPSPPSPALSTSAPSTPGVAADDLQWVTVAGASLPVSRSAGPHDTADGLARGFTRTPLGAVLAAAHITARLCPQAGPAVYGATLRDQVVGANTAALARHLDDDYQQARAQLGVPYGQPAGRLYSTTRGYRLDTPTDTITTPPPATPGAATGADVTVRLLIEGPGVSTESVLVAVVVHLRWTGTDWAVIAPAGGDWDTAASLVTDPTGYTRFGDGG